MARLTALKDHLDANPGTYGPLADWEVAEALNAPDPAYPAKKDLVSEDVSKLLARENVIGNVRNARSNNAGGSGVAAARNAGAALEQLIEQNWSKLETSDPAVYADFEGWANALETSGDLSVAQRDALLALADDTNSWAEENGYGSVTSRDVSQARAGNLTYGE